MKDLLEKQEKEFDEKFPPEKLYIYNDFGENSNYTTCSEEVKAIIALHKRQIVERMVEVVKNVEWYERVGKDGVDLTNRVKLLSALNELNIK